MYVIVFLAFCQAFPLNEHGMVVYMEPESPKQNYSRHIINWPLWPKNKSCRFVIVPPCTLYIQRDPCNVVQ